MLVFRCALNEMQNMSVLERDHVPMRGEVDEIRRRANSPNFGVPERVEIVGEIVGGEFPSAIDIPNLWNADELDLAGAAENNVEIPLHVAEPLVEQWCLGVQVAKISPR